jgi:hypothetical protein
MKSASGTIGSCRCSKKAVVDRGRVYTKKRTTACRHQYWQKQEIQFCSVFCIDATPMLPACAILRRWGASFRLWPSFRIWILSSCRESSGMTLSQDRFVRVSGVARRGVTSSMHIWSGRYRAGAGCGRIVPCADGAARRDYAFDLSEIVD